jgi:hypothetical protein
MKATHLSLAAIAACALSTSAYAFSTDKLDMKNNMMITYKETPKNVNTFKEMFSEGILYGRLRSNTFYWDWENENPGKTKDNFAWGVGGSLIYSTGYLYGFGATAGMYTTNTIATDNTDSAYPGKDFGKAGKDTYSRLYGSGANIDVLAIAYLEYKFAKTDIKYGRQIFESTLLRSNDTKMIPNTFQGVSIVNKDLPATTLRAAYFDRQKLRDHREFHSVIAYDGWKQNDDAAVNKGLSIANITAAGKNTHPGMYVATIENKSIPGLKVNVDGMYIPEFVSSVIGELNYKIKLGGSGWSLTPGARYIQQMDEGAGKIGGAALTGAFGLNKTPSAAALASYDDPYSVNGGAWMARVKLAKGPFDITGGYSQILDKADLIAPWRGFPTGGYTRSMGQYNWEANTASWMVKTGFNFGKAGLVPGLYGALDYAYMDYDKKKIDAGTIGKTDRSIIHMDLVETLKAVPDLYLKFRTAHVSADKSPGAAKNYNSYSEYRFEIDYFF